MGSSLFAQPLMLEAVPLADERKHAEMHRAADAGRIARGARRSGHRRARRAGLRADRPGHAERPPVAAAPLVLPAGEATRRRSLLSAATTEAGRSAASCAAPRGLRWANPSRWPKRSATWCERNPADEAQKPARTKILHEGRPDVERIVPVVDKSLAHLQEPPQIATHLAQLIHFPQYLAPRPSTSNLHL